MVNVHGGRDWSAATRDSSLKFSRLSVTFLHGRGGPYKALSGHHYWSGATRVRDQSQPCVWFRRYFKPISVIHQPIRARIPANHMLIHYFYVPFSSSGVTTRARIGQTISHEAASHRSFDTFCMACFAFGFCPPRLDSR